MLRSQIEEGNARTALACADLSRLEVSPTLNPERKSALGQFMTPGTVATFIASMFGPLPRAVRLLDAGAGMGALTAAFVYEIVSRDDKPDLIEVTAFEVDSVLADRLELTLSACTQECEAAGVPFRSRIVRDDYILHASEPLMSNSGPYSCAILNPPYAKINSTSGTRLALRRMGIETSNLYAAFVAVALGQLQPSGQLVAITPRSFCNGRYFEPFRRLMLEQSAIHQVHVYESRKKAFADDDVLQENIIYKLIKSDPQPAVVRISSSSSPQDTAVVTREVPFEEVVLPNDPHKYIRLALSVEDGELAERVRGLSRTLSDLGIAVSTGRVVDFRAKEHLRKQPEPGTVPLIYPVHFAEGFVAWPQLKGKKHNALASNERTADLVVPRGTYVLTKRFTSKEEARRLVAVVYDPERVHAEHVGFENHLNYFHVNGRGLPATLAKGLALFLNSTAVDQYFRQFSGHTQVNATDLRNLHYPTREQLEEAGRRFGNALPAQHEIDATVEALFS